MDKLCVALFLLVASFAVINAYPVRQWLPHRPGYVPVYIRNGDTPLEDINLELAEAFHAIPSGRSAGRTIVAMYDEDDAAPKAVPEVKKIESEVEPVPQEPAKAVVAVDKTPEVPALDKLAQEVAKLAKE